MINILIFLCWHCAGFVLAWRRLRPESFNIVQDRSKKNRQDSHLTLICSLLRLGCGKQIVRKHAREEGLDIRTQSKQQQHLLETKPGLASGQCVPPVSALAHVPCSHMRAVIAHVGLDTESEIHLVKLIAIEKWQGSKSYCCSHTNTFWTSTL